MSALLGDWFPRISVSDTNRIMDGINTGMADGSTTDTIINSIFGTDTLNGADGLTEIARRDASAIAQTAIAQTATDARGAWTADNTDIIGKEVWVATLDGVTCEECGALDGQVFDVGDGSDQCPAHINCRCVVVPSLDGSLIGDRPFTTATEDDLTNLSDMTDEERAAAIEDMTGQVPASTTYQEWLADQPADFQDEVLGPQRSDLFRSGDITLDQFISPDGSLYTLDELRAQGILVDETAPIVADEALAPLAADEALASDANILTDITPGIKATTEADVIRLEEAWAAQSDVQTVADLLQNSVENDAMLQAAGQAAADTLDGVTWNPGPIKTQDSIDSKLIRRGLTPAQITDVVRGTAYLDTPAQADAFVAKIATQFPVLDANWRYISESGYFDRTIKLLMPDGTVGEIQMGPKGMFVAKADASVGGSGGHTLYNLWKDASVKFGTGSDEAVSLLQDMQAIYGAAQSQLPQDWQTLINSLSKDAGISITAAQTDVQAIVDEVAAAAVVANKSGNN